MAMEQAAKEAVTAAAARIAAARRAATGGFSRTSASGFGGATASGLSRATASRLAAAVAVEKPAAKETVTMPAAWVNVATGRGTATGGFGRTATSWLATAAAKHASEHLERTGFRRAADQHRAGANHREDDSTTHEERSFKKTGELKH